MSAAPETVRLLRVFVSSPGDVAEERAVLDEVVARINRTDGRDRGVRLELWKWETDAVPQIGPPAQALIDGQTPPYEIYVGILGQRFGTPTGTCGSGTEHEFRSALQRWVQTGAPWILFYFSDMPIRPREVDLEQFGKVQAFRRQIEERRAGLYATYETVRSGPESFYEKAFDDLRRVLHRLVPASPLRPARTFRDPTAYLRDLREKTAHIDIRGLSVGTGKAHRFPIEELFIALTAAGGQGGAEEPCGPGRSPTGQEPPDGAAGGSRPLEQVLQRDRLVVIGDPGSGKTTFLRRVAYTLCLTELGEAPAAARERLGLADRTFPLLIRSSDLAAHLAQGGSRPDAPAGPDVPAWLPHYLAAAGAAYGWDLDEGFFREQLESGGCTVLLDGLDEAPDRRGRERLGRLIENAARAYRGCRFVVTTRPAAYQGEAVLPGFDHARIEPLADAAVETFLSRWCAAAYGSDTDAACTHGAELLAAVRTRPEIRRMARNPVMLTALAVVHWNERRLPEQRADLYQSIITWLSRSREQRAGRATAERTVTLLQELALALQADAAGRQTQVPRRAAAEKIAPEFASDPQGKDALAQAEKFLDEEELDSGIVVARGTELAFWHLTFQEFLAAKAIAARREAEQQALLWRDPQRPYLADWREVILLLAGVLHGQGRAKVDGWISPFLEHLGPAPTLAEQARCYGLLGAVLRDLEPLKYSVSDGRYAALAEAVTAIYDRQRSASVPVETRLAAGDALGQAGDARLDHRRDDYWVAIPAGRFVRGAQSKKPQQPNFDEDAFDERESPPHAVTLAAYRIARYPVTVGQYQQFVADDGYSEPPWWTAGGFEQFQGPQGWEQQQEYPSRPVVGVSWLEAAAFCAWAGVRLPTEAEWERAARGTETRKYPWGNEPPSPERLNFADSGIGHPTPVGIYPLGATPEGICDMAGNVWEWCADWYAKYTAQPATDPHGPAEAAARVIRGGGWGGSARYCRAAFRDRFEPSFRYVLLGFRVARGP